MSRIPEPERPGYIFLGWEPELPETMPEGELTVHALWEPGESQYTVLRWMEHAEDEEYSLLGEPEVRTARTGSTVTASQEDIDRAGEMADWFPDSDEYKDFYGFDYAGCSETVVTADGKLCCIFIMTGRSGRSTCMSGQSTSPAPATRCFPMRRSGIQPKGNTEPRAGGFSHL